MHAKAQPSTNSVAKVWAAPRSDIMHSIFGNCFFWGNLKISKMCLKTYYPGVIFIDILQIPDAVAQSFNIYFVGCRLLVHGTYSCDVLWCPACYFEIH